ncbi:MAG: hypothetical protein D6714_10625 [Bacteroidetes bacterium]|nr:MAG: hypothetical protein D6714_10625 [Bacteroidota bacterium]
MTETRAGKSRKKSNLCRSPKTNRIIHFHPLPQTPHGKPHRGDTFVESKIPSNQAPSERHHVIFCGKNVPVFAPGRGLRGRSGGAFACVGFVGKSIQWAVFFIWPRPAPAKVGKRETCVGRPKQTESFTFYFKKTNHTRISPGG